MQKEVLRGGETTNKNNSTDSSPHLSRNLPLSPSENQSESIDFTSFCHSMFPPSSNSLSITPSDCSFDEDVTNSIATENRLHQARFVLEYQQLYNRYSMCLSHLQESLKEIDSLREENDNLRLNNADLVNRLSFLSQATIQNCLFSSGHQPLSFINDFNRLSVGGTVRDTRINEEIPNISPTSVIERNRFDRKSTERVTLPKSISVRSSGYLKMTHCGGSNGGSSSGNRVKSPVLTESQRVYVPGGKREEEALEFEVYNQGMFKTELCNKWQETGKCPYGDNCQFAHGIMELRPVIRHPRYKTEVCRMVLAGDTCPYGHRCHFRHSLTDQEKLLGTL
ncbi:zinc finger CCCH domain-containing protein 14-like [Actinidia eriantha]|uniref:zinc finger CCCH domain-containing protein 14-like n=1 Tax=Actinidia eriantha TaxID=165200 RepID=UPI002584A1E0|nr:zinc finger CCCH domain-containing protein 14-like [Actinidia eriantha]